VVGKATEGADVEVGTISIISFVGMSVKGEKDGTSSISFDNLSIDSLGERLFAFVVTFREFVISRHIKQVVEASHRTDRKYWKRNHFHLKRREICPSGSERSVGRRGDYAIAPVRSRLALSL
jgi:hypothetical protein